MKILFLLRSLEVGGAERQAVALAKGLHNLGHQVAVATFYTGGGLVGELTQAGIEQICLNKKGRWHFLGFVWSFIRAVRGYRPDILHPYLNVANVLSIVTRPFLGPCRIVWGVRAADMPWGKYDWVTRLVAGIERLLARHADYVIANSYAGRDYAVAHGYPADRITVVPNGIDTDRFCINPVARRHKRYELGLSEGCSAVGVVARLDPQKNYEGFLRAARILSDRHPDMRFFCIGDGKPDYVTYLKGLSEELELNGVLTWLGRREDMPELYNALDVMCSASLDEGFSNAIGEAMACGVPCAVTDVGDSAIIADAPDQVALDRKPETLAIAIECAAVASETAQDRRRRMTERYSVQNLVKRSEAVLEAVLGRGLDSVPGDGFRGDIRPVDVLRWLWRYKVFLALCTFVMAAMAATYSLTLSRSYEAKAVLRPVSHNDLQPDASSGTAGVLNRLAGSVMGGGGGPNDGTVTLAYMKSMDFLSHFIKKEDLLPQIYPGRWDAQKKAWIGKPPSMEDAVNKLRNATSVDQGGNGLISLDVTWSSPEKAQWIADQLIAQINLKRQKQDLAKATANLSYLERRLRHETMQEMRMTLTHLASRELTKIMLAQRPGEYALEIISPPFASRIPVAPQRKLITLIGAIFGFLAAALGLLVYQALKNTREAD